MSILTTITSFSDDHFEKLRKWPLWREQIWTYIVLTTLLDSYQSCMLIWCVTYLHYIDNSRLKMYKTQLSPVELTVKKGLCYKKWLWTGAEETLLRGTYAANLSSQQSQARQDPRFQSSNEDQVGAAHYQAPSCQGPQAFDSLMA